MQIKVGATQTERNLALCLKTFFQKWFCALMALSFAVASPRFPVVKRSSVRERLDHERQNPI